MTLTAAVINSDLLYSTVAPSSELINQRPLTQRTTHKHWQTDGRTDRQTDRQSCYQWLAIGNSRIISSSSSSSSLQHQQPAARPSSSGGSTLEQGRGRNCTPSFGVCAPSLARCNNYCHYE